MTENNNAKTISTLLRMISIKEQKILNEKLYQTQSVTTQQAMVLHLIATKPGLIQKEVVDVVKRRAATVSIILKKLESAGLIIRKIPQDNVRNKELYLTERGHMVVESFSNVLNTVSEELSKNLTNNQKKDLIQLLNVVNQGLDS